MTTRVRTTGRRRCRVLAFGIACVAIVSSMLVVAAEQPAVAQGKQRFIVSIGGGDVLCAVIDGGTARTSGKGGCGTPTSSPEGGGTPTATVPAAGSTPVPPKPTVTNDDGPTDNGCNAALIDGVLDDIGWLQEQLNDEWSIVVDEWAVAQNAWEEAYAQWLNDEEDTDPTTNSPHPGPRPDDLETRRTNLMATSQTSAQLSALQQHIRSYLGECDPASAPGAPCAPVAALYHSYLSQGDASAFTETVAVERYWGATLPTDWAVNGIQGTDGYGALTTDDLMACFCIGSGSDGPPDYFPTGWSDHLINWQPEEDAGDPHTPQNHPCVDWAIGQTGGSGGDLPDDWTSYWNEGDFTSPGRPSWFLMSTTLGYNGTGDESTPPLYQPGEQVSATLNGVVVGTWVFTGDGCFTFVGSGGNTNPELGAIDEPPGDRCPDSQ